MRQLLYDEFQLWPIVGCMAGGVTLSAAYVTYMCLTKPDIRFVLAFCLFIGLLELIMTKHCEGLTLQKLTNHLLILISS